MRGRRTRPTKRVGLPRPPRPVRDVAGLGRGPRVSLEELVRRREALAHQLELLDAGIEALAVEALDAARARPIGGGGGGPVDVELYDGSGGVGRLFVDHHESAVGQLRWVDDLDRRFDGRRDSPGNVAGVHWGSGAMISADLFLTAGHCFDPTGGGWQRPRRGGELLPPGELARLMRVVFDYQVDRRTGELRAGESYPVLELVEHRYGGLDFAILRLGAGASGEGPGIRHGHLRTAAADRDRAGATVCLIQHPQGAPKRLETGRLRGYEAGRILYDGLDTLGGASGACILSGDGRVVGVHTHGGPSVWGDANFGVAIGAIRAVSEALPRADHGSRRDRPLLRLVR